MLSGLESAIKAQVEAQISAQLSGILESSATEATSNFAGLYGSKSSQLSSTGAYSKQVSVSGLSGRVTITPTATPQPSFIGRSVIGGSHSYMMEVGGQMDWATWLKSGRRVKKFRPAVAVHDSAEQFLVESIRSKLTSLGFKVG